MPPQFENIRGGQGEGILEWLAAACSHFKERIAIESPRQALSYGVLDDTANRIANCLLANGVSSGSIVVVLLHDRIATIAALIGIFRAGAVFVPLDASSSEERLLRLVTDFSPDVFIIEESDREKVNAIMRRQGRTARLILLDGCSLSARNDGFCLVEISAKDFSTESPVVCINPNAIRYIYYTSGSTGQPKGIAGRLAGLSHFIQWEIETFNIDVGWRFSQFISPTFDAYFRDVLVPLCVGGTVCIPPDSPGSLETNFLIDWIDRGKIDLIHCVPSLLRAILRGHLSSKKFTALKHVLLSGEMLHISDVKRWMEVFGDRIALVNLYGATETTMVKFFHIVQQSDLSRGFIPIGKPIKGARALVLDDRQRVCPPGVAGEIYIRTPFRTLGYYKNPEATKEVFVQNPFNGQPDDLIYRTGDLGLILNDGNFRFLGRKDNQVKIRGIRVELGEIENQLLNHPLVDAAVVLARDDAAGELRLAAYIVARQGSLPSIKSLIDWLKQELPEYMVPSAFVFLDSLPVTPNGKVDRHALPALDHSGSELQESFVAPRNAVEQTLVEIWSQVLNLERVGIHDDFFALGGHSLLAMQVISKVLETLQVELPVRSFFEAPTVAGLAKFVETIRWSRQEQPGLIENKQEREQGDL